MSRETRPGVCPKCGGGNLNYECSEPCDESIKYPYTCEDCGFEGVEWYGLQFAGHWDTDGNELEEQENESG